MPTYQYVCERCSHEFEAFHAMSATPPSCPACVAHSPRRIISGGSGTIFKGSGFYATDYRAKPEASKRAVDALEPEAKIVERV